MTDLAVESWLERYRAELIGYCYRMLGSAAEAEDAVQETLTRAWQGFDAFEGRSAVRSWLYRIATNVCLNMRKSGQRRARPMDLASPAVAGAPLGAPLPEAAWVGPIPDLPPAAGGDPAEVVVSRERISLAFVAALQYLTPRQRAVLIMRDVLSLRADEVAASLDTTVAAVKSTLQRARAALAGREIVEPEPEPEPYRPADAAQRALLARYVDAFQRHDFDALVALLHEDATMSMPPFPWWLRGREEIRRVLFGGEGACRGARLVPTVANGSPAFGQYRPAGEGGHEPFALVVVDVSGGWITGLTTFLDATGRFPSFALPARLP
ncbi:RNA polymerase subunit sigma-70 [Spongiactinospora rosea]|uniref:RNA polymerase subunit sigma-70 n=1 Tax=Spongiactinospora rosea TaxID=2248750 RepID=A0A366LWK3_9ACTN|nr:sigma-70 family RNA polymerase sigma factor [Spongiactinospora rosea]RBQ18301.1 RNA polymerase subunit sigma-70 [Spongiactinospora rosea]